MKAPDPADLETAGLCDLVLHAAGGGNGVWLLGLAPEAARRLRQRDGELRDIARLLEIVGEPLDGEVVEAIEELQRQAARVAELERIVALLKCDAGRGAVS